VAALWCGTSLLATRWLQATSTAVVGLGAVATDAEEKKKSKYSSLSPLHYFTPIAVETFGAIGESAIDFFSAARTPHRNKDC